MILPEDAEFHAHDPASTYWTETIGFWFAVPEEEIYGNIYVLARPNVGATIASVNVVQGNNQHPFTVDFTDPQMHAPCPSSMLDFDLGTGLAVKVVEPPTGYDFTYSSAAGACDLELSLRGTMPAWDPNDPDENPLLTRSQEHSDLGLGDAWAGGHLDFLGRVTGKLTLRGRTYEVNSMGGMDRSWGTRTELGQAAISYVHIPFDEELGIHLVTGIELDRGKVLYEPLRFGYVQEGDEVHGIVDVQMVGHQQGLLPFSNSIHLTDVRGRNYELRGRAIAGAPWYTFSPSYVTFQGLMHYELDGRHAYGLMADTYGIEYLADRTSRHGTRTQHAYGPGI